MKERGINILFIAPLCYRPDLPNFSGRYRLLPDRYSGQIICRTSPEFDGQRHGNFVVSALRLPRRFTAWDKMSYIFAIVATGYRLHKAKPLDVIHCYDPLALGVAGTLLKILTKAKLVIEVNGHLLTAGFLKKKSIADQLKKLLFALLLRTTLAVADGIKCINRALIGEVGAFIHGRTVFTFSDYVPISLFHPSSEDDRYIFFAGHPFHLKGVDLLVRAFKRLSDDYPDYRLVIMGHNRVDLESYQEMAAGCPAIEFRKPVPYDEMPALFARCTFFVLPSRSEAMGRVLLEAMASGKAVMAARVGGIPEVVEENVTGLLFKSEDVTDLELKMRQLLECPLRRRAMGAAGRERVERCYSEAVYGERFVAMIDRVVAG